MKNQLFFFIPISMTAAFLFNSCKKDASETPKSAFTENNENTVYVEKGILHVLNLGQIDSLYNQFELQKKKLKGGVPNLFSSNSFKSMYECFEEIVDAETAIADDEEKHPEKYRNAGNSVGHTDLVAKYPRVVTIRRFEDGSGYYEPNVSDVRLMPFLNPDGIIAVGNELHQYSKDTLKILKNVDVANIDKLKNASTNLGEEIEVVLLDAANPSKTTWGGFSRMKEAQSGRYKLLLYLAMRHRTVAPNRYAYSPVIATTRSLQKRLFGAWWDNYKCEMTFGGGISGNYTPGKIKTDNTSWEDGVSWNGALSQRNWHHTLTDYAPKHSYNGVFFPMHDEHFILDYGAGVPGIYEKSVFAQAFAGDQGKNYMSLYIRE